VAQPFRATEESTNFGRTSKYRLSHNLWEHHHLWERRKPRKGWPAVSWRCGRPGSSRLAALPQRLPAL